MSLTLLAIALVAAASSLLWWVAGRAVSQRQRCSNSSRGKM